MMITNRLPIKAFEKEKKRNKRNPFSLETCGIWTNHGGPQDSLVLLWWPKL